MAAPPTPFAACADGLALALRVTPRARRNRIEGVAPGGDGRPRLRVSVTAPPEGGKANAAAIALLAKSWRLPKGAFTVRAGQASRDKTLHIAGDPALLAPRLEALIRGGDG